MTYICNGCGRESSTNLLPCIWCGRKAWRLVDKPTTQPQVYVPEHSPWWGFGTDSLIEESIRRGDRS